MTQINTASPRIVRTDHAAHAPAIWWGPVTAGAVSAIAVQFFFTVLGIAIGISTSGGSDGVNEGMGVAAGAWWLITGTLSLLIGGVVVGVLMGHFDRLVLALHALAMWALVALFGFLVIWSGAGMATDAVSPLAAIAGEQTDLGLPALGRDLASGPEGTGARTFENDRVVPAQAHDIAQASAWWSVVGLLLGVAASVAGAVMGVRWWRRPV